ncbi:insulinase family protein [Pseudoflavitalea sp. X16]|uniref:M16 family metallopeptidase n=1 Tax=Paraflavitalea devenefica TaxID=2716334 RepID=UPI001421C576|nr:insulinase family protein [Paraflavitalea devenefica]NII26781.1 insulinase family protein [Paraflavitalea devenefica]
MRLYSRKTAAGILCLLLNGTVWAQQDTEAVPLDAAITTGKLPNGFTYYIRRNTTPEKRAVMYLVNKVGSILETDAQRGLAHFLEHMAFNGTTHYPKNELVNYLQKSGVRFGADLNATTSFDETIYQLPVTTDDKVLFRNALQVLRDWAQGITLDAEEIDKERGVILEEKRQRLGASQRIQDKVLPVAVNQSLYASRLPIGTEEVLKTFKYEEIRKFYQDWYRPDLQALIVVGDVNVQQVEKAIKALFSDLRMPSNARERKYVNIPFTGKNQFLAVTDNEVQATRLELTIKHPVLKIRTKADFREAMMRNLFNMMMGNRFNEILQTEHIPFSSAGCSVGGMMANMDALSGRVVLKPGQLEKGIKAWWTELERVKQYGFVETELKRATTNYLAGITATYKERDKTPSESYVREYVEHFVSGVSSPGIAYEQDLYKSFANQLTVADFRAFVTKYLKETDRDIVMMANDTFRDSLPSEATVLQWFKEAEAAGITAYVDKKTDRTSLLDQPVQGGTITGETSNKEVGITELVLSNGVKVILKPTNFKKDQVLFNGYSPGGLSLVNDADFYDARMATSLVTASGVSDMPLLEVRNMLTGKNVAVSPFIDETAEGFSGSAAVEDLETALQLVYLYFTKPRKDPVAFNNMVERIRLSFVNADQSPGKAFNDTLSAVLGNYHFRKMQMPLDKVDQLDADKAMMIYKDRFADASDFTFTFVGSFDVAAVKPLLAKYLGALPAVNRKEQPRDLHLNYPEGRVARKVVKGKEPQANVMLVFSGGFTYTVAAANQLRALAAVLNIRLTERLREQEGGVYGVRVNANVRKLPSGEYALLINFICDPRNVEPLVLSVNSEIMKLKQEGPSEDDMTKYKATDKTGYDRALKENGFWLSYLAGKIANQEEPEMPDQKKKLQHITPQLLQEAAIHYFNNANYIRVILVPENN